MTTPFTPEHQLYVIQSQGTPVTLLAFAGYVLAGTLVGLSVRDPSFETLNTGLISLALLAAVVNGALTLGLFPWLFTGLSRCFGAATERHEVRAITALSLVPVILATLLSLVVGLGGPLAVLGSLVAGSVFVHGLSLANGVTFRQALRHTLVVWVVLILGIILLSAALGTLLT
ncbi:hypothetical protein [Deinococcus planocerae]|uniref:hypothetical protein n=1 Tax=Deinococcus planocerae TaxID=1737569 RepID=UPI000C7EAF67|nr:hypothetical protein [Deinococcus planocerae]